VIASASITVSVSGSGRKAGVVAAVLAGAEEVIGRLLNFINGKSKMLGRRWSLL
jgi:hypothetical protein